MVGPSPIPRAEQLPAELVMIATRVEGRLREILDDERRRWAALDVTLSAPVEALSDLVLSGGKRLRPAFCHWGFVGAGGDPADPRVVDAGAAFELLQGFALIHDDVMDGSSVRRGAPAVHRRFADRHGAEEMAGEGRRFGEGAAILIGDLAFVYADRVLPTDRPEVTHLWHELRVELNVGQYLDLEGTATRNYDRVSSRRITRYKSGKYTIERPLQLGAALAGRHDLTEPLARYGDPLGEAFQLRDDVLGAFGDQALTGKPVGDDLREGKPTLLLAVAHENADDAQRRVLDEVGDAALSADRVAAVQQVLVDTGAVAATETEIERLRAQAVEALGPVPIAAAAREALVDLAAFVVTRKA